MPSKGMLFVMMQPPPAFEAEFNAWYDSDHVPERMAIPGFEQARRYVCLSGWPKYLAIYDLADPGVLETPAYKKVALENFTAWTQRVLSNVRSHRYTGAQVSPGDKLTSNASRLLALRFQGVGEDAAATVARGLEHNFAGRPEVVQTRVVYCPEGVCLGLVEARVPLGEGGIDISAFGDVADRLDLVNLYASY